MTITLDNVWRKAVRLKRAEVVRDAMFRAYGTSANIVTFGAG
jgi:hypothetical protein